MSTRRDFMLSCTTVAAVSTLGATPVADWDIATPQSQGLRADALAAALDAGALLPGLRSVAVARGSTLVAERYVAGSETETLHPLNSATKSVCSMLVGLALQDGRLPGLDATVAQLLPEATAEVPDSPAAGLTLRQILTGRTGLAFDPMRFGQLAGSRQLVRSALSQPGTPVSPPTWTYNDALVALLAAILERAQGAELSTLAARQLFDPLGIERFHWRRDRDGNPLAPAGLSLRTRDLLKLAVLMMNQGRWRGTAVLPETWVRRSLTPEGPASWRAGPVEEIGYGLLWFTGVLHGHRVAWAWGYGGQFALVAPGLRLAVATAAAAPSPSGLRAQTDAVMTLVGELLRAAGPAPT